MGSNQMQKSDWITVVVKFYILEFNNADFFLFIYCILSNYLCVGKNQLSGRNYLRLFGQLKHFQNGGPFQHRLKSSISDY